MARCSLILLGLFGHFDLLNILKLLDILDQKKTFFSLARGPLNIVPFLFFSFLLLFWDMPPDQEVLLLPPTRVAKDIQD